MSQVNSNHNSSHSRDQLLLHNNLHSSHHNNHLSKDHNSHLSNLHNNHPSNLHNSLHSNLLKKFQSSSQRINQHQKLLSQLKKPQPKKRQRLKKEKKKNQLRSLRFQMNHLVSTSHRLLEEMPQQAFQDNQEVQFNSAQDHSQQVQFQEDQALQEHQPQDQLQDQFQLQEEDRSCKTD